MSTFEDSEWSQVRGGQVSRCTCTNTEDLGIPGVPHTPVVHPNPDCPVHGNPDKEDK